MSIVDALLRSEEPTIRWKVRTRVLGEATDGPTARKLREAIRQSPRVRRLLAARDADGRITNPKQVYAKWHGAHWVLAALADLGYPPGDESLYPLRDQVLRRWLRDVEVPQVQGRYRHCASQQGNALRYLTALGILDGGDARTLTERLVRWQWPDGGWNCDRNPTAQTSSFMETLLPMRGLARHDRAAATRAAEVFLLRRLAWRRADGALVHPDFARLHHPLYWHYDALGGLVGMVEAGTIGDPRCADALDLLESKRLPDGGWPAEKAFTTKAGDPLDWGPTGTGRANEWVTADALAVLAAAGRFRP
ncbi:hypothetical protein [Phytohabitans kaempferiae]|uniref:Squalene cyclase C-terminal domain-containing protein n=1 Tax=Phytohabitans kaempferiae TaxID=1620943 RepID=A0ABV6MDZ8_9ACTN